MIEGKSTRKKLLDATVTWVLPLALTVGTLAALIPFPLESDGAGALGFLCRAADEHLLLSALALFLVFWGMTAHWMRRLRAARARPSRAEPTLVLVRVPEDSAASEASAPATAPTGRRRRFLLAAALAAVAFLLIRPATVQRVWGGSMTPTLNIGDRVLVNRLAYGLQLPFSWGSLPILPAALPRRGDVIVFANLHPGPRRDGEPEPPALLVKRVIGLPSDVVEFRDGSPIINGWVVPSCDAGPFLAAAGPSVIRGRLAVEVLGETTYLTVRRPFAEAPLLRFRVPAGEVFVIGDERGGSYDSRAWGEGRGAGVPVDAIEGRVTRLALGRSARGGPGLHHLMKRLGLEVREPEVDLRRTQDRIAACVAHPPGQSSPPPAAAEPTGTAAPTAFAQP